MTPEQLAKIKETLGLTHKQLADRLGVSEVSVKRMTTKGQVITDQTEIQAVQMMLIENEGLQPKFERLLRKCQKEAAQQIAEKEEAAKAAAKVAVKAGGKPAAKKAARKTT